MFLKISPFVTTLRDNLKKVSLHKALIKQVIRKFYSDEIGDVISFSEIPGIQHLRNPRLNKGLAFSMEERQALGIHGLQPAVLRTQEEQVAICKDAIEKYEIPLNKYLFLNELRERNEKLYFRLVSENIEKLLPIIYTPTVGLVCQKFGLIYRRPRGLYITINDIGYVYNILRNWPEHTVQAIVVTDGERILGLGDLGTYGMGISIGKLSLYTALAGIKPHRCLPICLDVGTNNEKLLEDPVYIGLRQKRIRGKLYDDFLDEFMEAVVKRYGQDTLIQFEDFGTANAARLLEKYRDKYCTFNDDIQGTAAVVLAGLYATYKILGKNLSEHAFLFYGAGTAAMGIADLLVEAMLLEGSGLTEARSKIYMIDVHGLLTKSRVNFLGIKRFMRKTWRIKEIS
ncbi:hypothetical protein HHI36_021906 [Cryptolaemus montrouzieri]|uniref:Malic enzyme n=1 Tax=Cryptolaemus montrouzieri TaxID=559131 RepID=A0ABD2MYI2_9CUCU